MIKVPSVYLAKVCIYAIVGFCGVWGSQMKKVKTFLVHIFKKNPEGVSSCEA